ncbi:hypothetical protein JCM3765_001938 [Sporobolomyces pararoseus]
MAKQSEVGKGLLPFWTRNKNTGDFNLTQAGRQHISKDGDLALRQFAPMYLVDLPETKYLVPGRINKTPWLGPLAPKAELPKIPRVPPYKIVSTSEKGLGIVATRDIKAGEIIFAEKPLLKINCEMKDGEMDDSFIVDERLKTLSAQDRKDFESLSIAPPLRSKKKSIGIWRTNAYEFGDGAGVFLTASRFNHSCRPTVDRIWNEEDGKAYFIAFRDVRGGEELCTDYTGMYRRRHEREQHLFFSYGFKCKCQVCSLPPEEVKENDRARIEIAQINDFMLKGEINRDLHPLKFHAICCRGIELLRKHDTASFFEIELAGGAYMVSVLFGCRPIADIWMQELLKLSKRYGVVGKDRIDRFRFYEVMKEDPTCHPAWALYSKSKE